ncbi:hypothetical protein BN8_02816 [Fibrisoma limi BUZ 3]|uniref:Uncharacterized protein n=1 Tax=Fibrisoma limi BUZ 3 TaxID=1185876 RepID=I2GIH6_9BACT|nr:hypothetical protein BN8_02816 [Fibrisoma limi BUZ 3]
MSSHTPVAVTIASISFILVESLILMAIFLICSFSGMM